MSEFTDLIDRYIAAWNEGDAERRIWLGGGLDRLDGGSGGGRWHPLRQLAGEGAEHLMFDLCS